MKRTLKTILPMFLFLAIVTPSLSVHPSLCLQDAEAYSVYGVVYYSIGRLDGISVELLQDMDEWWKEPPLYSTMTVDGHYQFDLVPPGSYQIRAFGPTTEYVGWVGFPVEVVSEDVEQDIDLPKDLYLLSPENNSAVTTLTPTLFWEANSEAATYTIQINFAEDWELVEFGYSSSTSYTVQTELSICVQYAWSVDAYDAQDHWVGTTQPEESYFTVIAGTVCVTISPGVNVTVSPTTGLTLTFDNVESAGYVTAQDTLTPSAPALGNLVGKYCDIAVTAKYSGNVMIGLAYDDTNMTLDRESTLQMMQYTPIPGDVVNYGQVNILDIAFIATCFGTTPASPHWNATADINGDGNINILDIGTCAVNFGKTAEWTNVTTYVDTELNVVYGETTHFSIIGIH